MANKPEENLYIRRYTRNSRMVKALKYNRDMTAKILSWHKMVSFGGWARKNDLYQTHGDIIIRDEGKLQTGEWIVCESGNTRRMSDYDFHDRYFRIYHLDPKYVAWKQAQVQVNKEFPLGDAPHIHGKE